MLTTILHTIPTDDAPGVMWVADGGKTILDTDAIAGFIASEALSGRAVSIIPMQSEKE
jgi:hypothetical protein